MSTINPSRGTSPGDRPQGGDDRLALLYRLTRTFSSSLDLDEVLDRVMDEVIAAVRAERGFLMLKDGDGPLLFQVARGLDQHAIEQPRFQVSRGISERVAETGEAVLTSDARIDQRLNLRESVVNLGLRAVLSVPLKVKGVVIGVIYVDNRIQAGVFGPADLELLTAIAASAAIAIDNARLYREALEKGRLERELQLAREVQASLMPRTMPVFPGWSFAALWLPAREVAGDYFALVSEATLHGKDAPNGVDHLGLIVADITDKGMPAALFMALARSTIHAALAATDDPAAAITQANRLITADSPNSMFVTLGYVRVTAAGDAIECVNAGHPPILHYRAAHDDFQTLGRTGMPLGIDAEATFGRSTTRVQSGDLILLYSDGVPDARSPEGEEYGMTRLMEALRANARLDPQALIDILHRALDGFDGGLPQHDDITLLLAKRIG